MGTKYEQTFTKWETGKRQKLGEKKFLERYIKRFSIFDKINKIVFPMCAIICFFIMVWLIVNLVQTFTGGLYFAVIYSFMSTILFVLVSQWNFKYVSYEMYGKYIERWKKELENINKADK